MLFHTTELTLEAPDGFVDRTLNLFVKPSGETSINITRDDLGDKPLAGWVDAQIKHLSKNWPRFVPLGQRACTVGNIASREARMQWTPTKITLYQRQLYVPYYGQVIIVTATSPKAQAAQCDHALERVSSTLRFRKMSS